MKSDEFKNQPDNRSLINFQEIFKTLIETALKTFAPKTESAGDISTQSEDPICQLLRNQLAELDVQIAVLGAARGVIFNMMIERNCNLNGPEPG